MSPTKESGTKLILDEGNQALEKVQLRCKSQNCLFRLYSLDQMYISQTHSSQRCCCSNTLFSILSAVFISMPIAKYVCQQSEKAQRQLVPKAFLANQMDENMATSIRFPWRHLSVMKAGNTVITGNSPSIFD